MGSLAKAIAPATVAAAFLLPSSSTVPGTKAAEPRCSLTSSAVLRDASLVDVVALSPDDAWAVGNGGTNGRSVIEHWNGKRWRTSRAPSVGAINAVSATSSKNVWAVGMAGALHWNGRRWTRIGAPSLGLNYLTDVVTVARADVWAIGDDAQTNAVVAHWNGYRWRIARRTRRATHAALDGRSARDIWVLATEVDTSGIAGLHRTGAQWQPLRPRVATANTRFEAIRDISQRDVWIAGEADNEDETGAVVAERWDGSRWASPETLTSWPRLSFNTVTGLAGRDDNLWLGGYGFNARGRNVPLTLHRDPSGWAFVRGADIDAGIFAVGVAGRRAWAVGSTSDHTDPPEQGVIEQFDCTGSES